MLVVEEQAVVDFRHLVTVSPAKYSLSTFATAGVQVYIVGT
jgi:hypothetical protein